MTTQGSATPRSCYPSQIHCYSGNIAIILGIVTYYEIRYTTTDPLGADSP